VKKFMSVGEVAKKMNTTVRTLQYYDREGILTPSAESEGGRRLYSDKDIIKLHQILSMKYLGFSLDDIKNRLVSLETPEEVTVVLKSQAEAIREKISSLSEVLLAVETLSAETEQMKTVDWHTYADIVALLQEGYKNYWMIKLFDKKMMSRVRSLDPKRGKAMLAAWEKFMSQAAKFKKNNVPPNSPQGLKLGKEFWTYINEFTGGDMSILPEMINFEKNAGGWDNQWRASWENARDYISSAMGSYFQSIGFNPFEDAQ
jgi:DNA-binding transcriptional MerR regulator